MWPFRKKVPATPAPQAVDSLIRGYRFCATLQLRTPLAVLEMHGREVPANDPLPPVQLLWHGTWLPINATWRELGLDINEMPQGSMASEIGYVPGNGGDFLLLLKRVREVVEAAGPVAQRRARLQSLLKDLPWPALVERLGGPAAVLDTFFPSFLAAGARVRPAAVVALEHLEKVTPRELMRMSDAELLSIPSIGPKMLAQIRSACMSAVDPDAAHVESAATQPSAG